MQSPGGGALSDRPITGARVIDAPRKQIWRAWTEPEQLVRWWTKPGWQAPLSSVEMDVRAGGVFRLTSVSDDGSREVALDGRFLDVVKPERLVFTETAPSTGAGEDGLVSPITFAAVKVARGKTAVVFHATARTNDAIEPHIEVGLERMFARLAAYLA
jgi:uncharacterized protein YndB with AHSA1/START domain